MNKFTVKDGGVEGGYKAICSWKDIGKEQRREVLARPDLLWLSLEHMKDNEWYELQQILEWQQLIMEVYPWCKKGIDRVIMEVEKEMEKMGDWWFHDDLGAVLGQEENHSDLEMGDANEAAEAEDEQYLNLLWDEDLDED